MLIKIGSGVDLLGGSEQHLAEEDIRKPRKVKRTTIVIIMYLTLL